MSGTGMPKFSWSRQLALLALLITALVSTPSSAQPSWEATELSQVSGRVWMSPTLAMSPEGDVLAAWITDDGVQVSRRDDTNTWSQVSRFSSSEVEGALLEGMDLAVDEAGIHVVIRTASDSTPGATRQLVYGLLSDEGWTFSTLWSDSASGGWKRVGHPSLVLHGATPTVAAVISDATNANTQLCVFTRAEGWSSDCPLQVTGLDATLSDPDIVLIEGQPALVVHERAEADRLLLGLDRDGWTFDTALNSPGLQPDTPKLVVDVDGSIAIVTYERGEDQVLIVRRSGEGVWAAAEPLDNTNGRGRGLTATHDGAAFAYLEDSERNLVVYSNTRQGAFAQIVETEGESAAALAALSLGGALIVLSQSWLDTGTTNLNAYVALLNTPPTITQGDTAAVTMSEDGDPTAFSLSLTAEDAEDAAAALVWSVAADPTNGMASVVGDGNGAAVSYTPATHFNGSDTFTLQVTDTDGGVDSITINVTVEPINDAPTPNQVMVDITMSEDGDPTAFSLSLTAMDVEDEAVALVWSVAADPTNGMASVAGDGNGAMVRYMPATHFNGGDTFTLQVTDTDGASTQVQVNVTVEPINDAPTLNPVGPIQTTMSEDGDPTPFALELTASDPDHDVLVLTWEVTQEPALGESSLEGSGATREVRYTPAPDVTGEDAFTITVRDPDGGSSEVDVAIIIEPVNDPPTPAVLSTMTVSENLGDNAVVGEWSAMDPEDSPEQLSFALAVGDGDDDNVLFTVDGNTLIAVENLDFEAGSELMLRVRVTDTEGATTEGPWMLQVLDTNDPPMGILLEPAEVFGDEEADTEVGTLQAQDQDVDDTHTFSFVEGEGDDDNALFTIEGAALLTTEALRASERDNYRIRVAATDGMSTVEEAITITVTDTPIAAGDSYTISMGDTLRVEAPGVLANDRPTGSVTAVLDANPTGGSLTLEEDGAFTYTPDMDFVGEDSFTYLAQRDDRMSEAATVIITVERRDMMPDTGMGDTDIPDTGLPDTDGSDTDMLDTDEPDAVSGDTDMPEPDTDGLDTATPDMGAPSDTSTGTDVTNVTTGGGSDGCTAVPFTAPVASSVWTVLMLVLGSFAVLRRRRPL